MTTTPYWYGADALTGFANGAASYYGVKCKVTVSQDPSCTDGTAVNLSMPNGLMTAEEFKGLCGVGLHEIAHCKYESVPQHKAFMNGDNFRADIFNAVIDIADESRLERQTLGIATGFFKVKSKFTKAMCKNRGTYSDPNVPLLWKTLTQAMWSVSGHVWDGGIWGSVKAQLVKAGHPEKLLSDAAKILRKAKQHKDKHDATCRGAGFPGRGAEQWFKIHGIAEELAKLMAPLRNPDGGGGAGAGGTEGLGHDAAEVYIAGAATSGRSAGSGQACAGASAGQAMVAGGVDAKPGPGSGSEPGASPSQPPAPSVSPPSPGGTHWSPLVAGEREFDESAYWSVYPTIRAAMDRMLESSRAEVWESGFATGTKLGKLVRYPIDGQVFSRRTSEDWAETDTAIAVVLDDSESMSDGRRYGPCAGIAQAFIDAAKGMATVACWTFNYYVKRMPGADLRNHWCSTNGTQTSSAIKAARDWLGGQSSPNRILIMLTDGGTNAGDTGDCIAATGDILSDGVRVIVMCLGDAFLAGVIARTMPGTIQYVAPTPNDLACYLAGLASELERA